MPPQLNTAGPLPIGLASPLSKRVTTGATVPAVTPRAAETGSSSSTLDSVLRAEVVDWSRVSPELMERWAEGINVATGLKHIGAWDGKARVRFA